MTVPSRKAQGGVFDRLASVFADDMKYLGQGSTHRLGRRPAGESLGHDIQKSHAAFGVGADDGIANAAQRDPQPFGLFLQSLFGSLAHDVNAPGVLHGDRMEPFFLVFRQHQETSLLTGQHSVDEKSRQGSCAGADRLQL